MSKGRVSIGDDTPTGEPANGPQGPYITDEEDDALAAARDSGKARRKTTTSRAPVTDQKAEQAPEHEKPGRGKGSAQP